MIRLNNVSKRYRNGKSETIAINNINMDIEKGEIYGIIGFSGAGKSTLIRCINLLERPSEGEIYYEDTNIMEMNMKKLRLYRKKVGMIFQQFNLLAQRTVVSNICYPLEISGISKKTAEKTAEKLLEIVDLKEKANNYPEQLSGGEKQRVAIARALATNPEVLLCDEATSALDPITTKSILSLLKEINLKFGVTIILITHEMKVVEQICDRVAVMNNGIIEEYGKVKEIFLNPKSETARKLILSDNMNSLPADINTIRIAFDGQSAFEPVISSITKECNVLVNILGANTENIGGKAYGQMLIETPKDAETAEKIRKYLQSNEIYYEEGGISNE